MSENWTSYALYIYKSKTSWSGIDFFFTELCFFDPGPNSLVPIQKLLDGSKINKDQVKGIESFPFFVIQVSKANVLLGSILLTYSWLEVLLKLTK